MDRIFFENIRCFANRQEARLAPLTILVGENSSGKSTFLALVRIAWDLVNLLPAKFNEEPFLLGAHDQIVSALRASGRDEFSLSVQVAGNIKVHGEFGPEAGSSSLKSLRLTNELGDFDLSLPDVEILAMQSSSKMGLFHKFGSLIYGGDFSEWQQRLQSLKPLEKGLGLRPHAFAPVRTRPRRTYDPVGGLENPEGSHVPAMLASVAFQEPGKADTLFAALDAFGRASGLFDQVGVRRLGLSESDPFQIQVRLGGNAVNLIDVGYGVSQILPIVVDCLRGKEEATYLLQQPEVHLHPSAQAELGSFLGVLAKQQEKRFVIETHSDYLVDRIRMDIRDGKGLKPEDVSLLYFERNNGKAQIHALELDEQGNILDPPPGYRRFFLEEERRLLGI